MLKFIFMCCLFFCAAVNAVEFDVQVNGSDSYQQIVEGDSLTISANVQPTDGTVVATQLLINGSVFKTLSTGPYTFSLPAVVGTHTLVLRVANTNDVISEASTVLTVLEAPLYLTNPGLVLTAVNAVAERPIYVDESATISVNWTLLEQAVSHIDLYVEGNHSLRSSVAPFDFSLSPSQPGIFNVSLLIEDVLGQRYLVESPVEVFEKPPVIVPSDLQVTFSVNGSLNYNEVRRGDDITVSASYAALEQDVVAVGFYVNDKQKAIIDAAPFEYHMVASEEGRQYFDIIIDDADQQRFVIGAHLDVLPALPDPICELGTAPQGTLAPSTLTDFSAILVASKLQAPTGSACAGPETLLLENAANAYFYSLNSALVFSMSATEQEFANVLKRRSELRQLADWKVSDAFHEWNGTVSIEASDEVEQFTFGQIYDQVSASPMLRLVWRAEHNMLQNHLWAVYKETPDGSSYIWEPLVNIDATDNANIHVKLSNSSMRITVDGVNNERFVARDVSAWGSGSMYFKAGCYLQTAGTCDIHFQSLTFK